MVEYVAKMGIDIVADVQLGILEQNVKRKPVSSYNYISSHFGRILHHLND